MLLTAELTMAAFKPLGTQFENGLARDGHPAAAGPAWLLYGLQQTHGLPHMTTSRRQQVRRSTAVCFRCAGLLH